MKLCREAVGQVGNQDVVVLDRTCHPSHVRDVKDRSQIGLRVRCTAGCGDECHHYTISSPPREIRRNGSLHLRTNTSKAWIGCYRIGRQLAQEGFCVVWSNNSSSQQAKSSCQIAEDGNRHSRSDHFPFLFWRSRHPGSTHCSAVNSLGPSWSMAVAAALRTGQWLQR